MSSQFFKLCKADLSTFVRLSGTTCQLVRGLSMLDSVASMYDLQCFTVARCWFPSTFRSVQLMFFNVQGRWRVICVIFAREVFLQCQPSEKCSRSCILSYLLFSKKLRYSIYNRPRFNESRCITYIYGLILRILSKYVLRIL